MDQPRRILLIRPSALGDVCRTVPVLVSLKRNLPDAEVDWLVQRGFEEAISAHPDLHRAILFDRRGLSLRHAHKPRWWREFRHLIGQLRGGYDLVIDAQGLFRSGFFAWATGARSRVGYAEAAEMGWLFLNRRISVNRGAHTVERMLGLVEGLGISAVRDMRLYTSEAQRRSVDARLVGKRYAVVAPTSRWAGKRWAPELFVEVVRAMLGFDAIDMVALVGAGTERAQCGVLLELAKRDDRVVDLVGGTSVGGLMATIEGSQIVVANDSAALHMAVGFDRAIVGLFGPTRIDSVGPYGRDADVLQAEIPDRGVSHKDDRAGRAMMDRLTVEQVVEAVRERLLSGDATKVVRSTRGQVASS